MGESQNQPFPLHWTRQTTCYLVVALACFRLCHIHLLWPDEDYHLAAAIHILNGKVPYRDFWYDKPPLGAIFYLLIGGYSGVSLRLLDAGYILLACYLAYRLARAWWSEAEGRIAALLLAFFTTFYLPTAVIPFAADALMIVPHLAAIYCARRKLPLWAGLYAGIGFLVNTKALFVLATCAIWLVTELALLLFGFALPVLAGVLGVLLSKAWAGYYEQVWQWGLMYSNELVMHPFRTGFVRTSGWIGFHAALAIGAMFGFMRSTRDDRWKLAIWLALSFAAVCLGTRFGPHYFLQLLPPLVIAGSRGIVLALKAYRRPATALLAIFLIVPVIRFGPRYVSLALDNLWHRDPHWSNLAVDLDVDSQNAAAKIRVLARPGDTLFVWGYRPDLYVYTRMSSDSRYWDSQSLTGVSADRHYSETNAMYGWPAAAHREKLAHSSPTFIVDGLGRLNPKLKLSVYPELRSWLADYRLVDETKSCWIYRRIEEPH